MIGRLLRRRRLHRALRHAPYPTHAWSLGMLDTEREPLTWFRCGVHGQVALGSPFEPPHHCRGAWSNPLADCGDWTPTSQRQAAELTAGALQ